MEIGWEGEDNNVLMGWDEMVLTCLVDGKVKVWDGMVMGNWWDAMVNGTLSPPRSNLRRPLPLPPATDPPYGAPRARPVFASMRGMCNLNPFCVLKGEVQCVKFHGSKPFLFVATKQQVRIYHLIKQV